MKYFCRVKGLDEEQIRAAAIDTLSCLIEFNPSMVREYMMKESQAQDDVSSFNISYISK